MNSKFRPFDVIQSFQCAFTDVTDDQRDLGNIFCGVHTFIITVAFLLYIFILYCYILRHSDESLKIHHFLNIIVSMQVIIWALRHYMVASVIIHKALRGRSLY